MVPLQDWQWIYQELRRLQSFFPPISAAQYSRSHTITINHNKCSDSSSSVQPHSTAQVHSALPRKSPSSSSEAEEATPWKDSCGYRMETVLVSCHQKMQACVRSCNSSRARSLLLHYCLLGVERLRKDGQNSRQYSCGCLFHTSFL